ncbi:MAG TPA: S41 family peptidase, partial [Bryobacteraceae bacterium]|nr:S41 family peptidase [Bryobacteraceae bacterium]
IAYPPVESKMLPDQMGYIKVAALTTGKVKEVATAIAGLQKQGAKKLLLDLRFCATGDPDEGIELANLFLNNGLITYVQGQKFARKNYTADPKKDVTALPLVVLTNRGTASAAEVTAAALQADKRATVVGERTYGDASLRSPITMEDGSAIILSVAKFYSPDGKSIQDNGITPNEQVTEAEPTIGDSDDDATDQTPNIAPKKPTEDVILKKAIEVAQKQTA